MATADVLTPSSSRVEPGSINIPVASFPSTTKEVPSDPNSIAARIIDTFNDGLAANDGGKVAGLFHENSYWRDHLGLTWDFRTFKGRSGIDDFFKGGVRGLKTVEIDSTSPFRAPHYGPLDGAGDVNGIEFFVNFTTELGSGQGICRLVEVQPDSWHIFSLFTTLRSLKGHEEATGLHRPRGVDHGGKLARKNWFDRRTAESNYEDGREPSVLILGEIVRILILVHHFEKVSDFLFRMKIKPFIKRGAFH